MQLSIHRPNVVLRLIVMLIMVMAFRTASSQYYNTGQEAASIHWKKIKTDHVRIIFPDYWEENARWLASYIDSVHQYASASLNYNPKRIPLILHTQTSSSNAVLAWAPKRMEYYATPPQDMYAQPWLEQLSIHEYRHVVQIEKLNQGPTKVISWLFGQQGTAAILGLYVPAWFLEGDAVVAETGLSYSGRGRVPLFEMKMRTQILTNGSYSYDKASMGSYKDFVPDAYELGYLLVSEARRSYGPEIWEHTLNRVARRPYMVTPFQNGIREISGKRKIPFYNDCIDSLNRRWEGQDRYTKTQLPLSPVNGWNKHYTDYRHPKFLNDSMILAMKVSMDDIIRFVSIDEKGKEKVIFTPGFLKSETLSLSSGKICWLETRPDPRWTHRGYTSIIIYDTKNGDYSRFKHKLRLFGPALSPDASSIVAVKIDSLNHYSLVIMDALSGVIKREIRTPANAFPLTPVWAGEDLILAVLVSEDGKTIAKFDVSSGRSKTLLNWEYTDISQPVYHAPFIYYTAGYSGISNIYALNIEEGEVQKVSSARFGAVDPCVSADGKTLLYADYSAEGYNIIRYPLWLSEWEALNYVEDASIGLSEDMAEQEEIIPPGSEIPLSSAPVKKYSKIGNLFNFHSWAPLDINASTMNIHPGVSIMSQNLLSSSFLTAGYSYNISEQAGKIYGLYTYSGWYPIIELGVDYGLRRDYAYLPEQTEIKWNETNLRAGMRLPLSFRKGKYYSGMQISVYANQGIRRMKAGMPVEFRRPDVFSMGYGISIYKQIKSNFKDIFPRWGQRLGLYYRHTPFQGDEVNYIAAVTLGLYFPGIIRHQGLSIFAGYQQRDIIYYKFSDIVPYPRGVVGKQDEKLFSLRATYAFPIAYPDWSIGPLIYMKRIRANIFYDYSFAPRIRGDRQYSSVGADLLTEVHILRFVAPFEFGVRSAYLPEEESFYWGFLFSVGFSSFYVGDGPIEEKPSF